MFNFTEELVSIYRRMSTEISNYLWVVDPHEEVRATIKKKTEKSGYFLFREIGSPLDLQTIINKINNDPPNLVLIDVFFPGIDTIQLIKDLKNNGHECRIIILSDCSDPEKIQHAIESGASFFVNKSIMHHTLFGIIDLITDRDALYTSLLKKDTELVSILETQQEMLCRFKPDTTLTFVNKAYADMFGKTPDQLVGVKFLSLIPQKDHLFIKRFLKSYTPEKHTQTYRHAVHLPDGSVGWQEWTDYAFFDKQGNITGYQSMGRDISNEVRLTNSLNKSEEKERMMISRELHDHLGQMLTYAKIKMEEGLAMPQDQGREQIFTEVLDQIIEVMEEVRAVSKRVVAGFVKEQPFDEMLKDLIHSFEQISKIRVKFCSDYIPDNLNQSAKNNLYRIIQEAFTNIVRHANANEVIIGLFIRGNNLNLVIRDNGKGADVNSKKIKDGFFTIRHRVDAFEGTIKFSSRAGQFFKMQIQLPTQNVFNNNGEPDGYVVHT